MITTFINNYIYKVGLHGAMVRERLSISSAFVYCSCFDFFCDWEMFLPAVLQAARACRCCRNFFMAGNWQTHLQIAGSHTEFYEARTNKSVYDRN